MGLLERYVGLLDLLGVCLLHLLDLNLKLVDLSIPRLPHSLNYATFHFRLFKLSYHFLERSVEGVTFQGKFAVFPLRLPQLDEGLPEAFLVWIEIDVREGERWREWRERAKELLLLASRAGDVLEGIPI